ncbi:MAG: purine phosphoribosyltransferase family protein [Methanoregulaceae archaeon]|nr:purine phosphoribosyltransferase family protein [Methanoregulaceae archaeon]
MLERLVKSLEASPIVKRGEYNYFINPITDGVPSIDPGLLREIAAAMVKVLNLDGVTMIVAAEAMGIHIGTALSLATDIPLNIVRKRQYWLPGEIAVHQCTGYSKGELYLNGISKGDRVVVIDDVISTGGTIRAVLQCLSQAGAEVVDVCFVIQRGHANIGRPFTALVTVDVNEGRVRVLDRYL